METKCPGASTLALSHKKLAQIQLALAFVLAKLVVPILQANGPFMAPHMVCWLSLLRLECCINIYLIHFTKALINI